ncbi:hypothetical protein DVK06_10680 [Halorubrum sp. Atlit-28R]|nr:hypothetical protein DVK06_10680 [Halorubrum sp. Atlit-28R]
MLRRLDRSNSLDSISSLIMAVGFCLAGLAESLPEERPQTASGLHVTAIVLLVIQLRVAFSVPETVPGP